MVAHDDVVWIGGPSGVGKSTIARLLARRHGLRWYSGDTMTWDHRDRALRANDPDALRFERLSPDQRAALPRPERKLLDLIPQRRRMVLDDLAHLPPAPLVVAESTLLEPSMINPRQAVWLTATTAELVTQTDRRGWGIRSLVDAETRRDEHQQLTAATALPVISQDGRGLAEILDDVSELFTDLLARGPVAHSRRERQQLIRAGNLAIVHQYRAGLTRFGRASELTRVVRTFDCECADPACQALLDTAIGLAPANADDPPLLSADHVRGEAAGL